MRKERKREGGRQTGSEGVRKGGREGGRGEGGCGRQARGEAEDKQRESRSGACGCQSIPFPASDQLKSTPGASSWSLPRACVPSTLAHRAVAGRCGEERGRRK